MLVIWFGIGTVLGWYASKAHTSFGEVRNSQRRLAAHMKHRVRYTLQTAGLVAGILFIIYVHFHQ